MSGGKGLCGRQPARRFGHSRPRRPPAPEQAQGGPQPQPPAAASRGQRAATSGRPGHAAQLFAAHAGGRSARSTPTVACTP